MADLSGGSKLKREMEMKTVMEAEPNKTTAVLINDEEEIQSSSNLPQSTTDEIIIPFSEPTTENKRKRDDEDEDESPTDSGQKNPLWKTSLCSDFRGQQGCSHGDSCRYAHGEAELDFDLITPGIQHPRGQRSSKRDDDDH